MHAPTYHVYFEILLLSGIIWLIFQRSYNIKDSVELTENEKKKLIEEWVPEPLVPTSWKMPDGVKESVSKQSESAMKKYVKYNTETNNRKHLNLLTYNFLDLTAHKEIQDSAISAMRHYGVGSCGPRGFYGTYDAHLNLEKDLKNFLGVQEVILYSYGFSTIASAIPSYAKRTDVIFADECVNQSIYQGLIASRSRIVFFKHNDISHLTKLLESQAIEDKEDPKRAQAMRRFLIIEGIYQETGKICNLPKILALKYKYKVRVFIDESISIGVLGATGRGVTEHFNINIKDVDLISGSTFVIDHQCLSGAGYCFSASSPPMLAVAMQHTLRIIDAERGLRQKKLKRICHKLHELFTTSLKIHWTIEGDKESPIKFIRLKEGNNLSRLEKAVKLAFDWEEENPLLLTVTRGVETKNRRLRAPSIRLSLNCTLSDEELDHIVSVFSGIGKKLLFTA